MIDYAFHYVCRLDVLTTLLVTSLSVIEIYTIVSDMLDQDRGDKYVRQDDSSILRPSDITRVPSVSPHGAHVVRLPHLSKLAHELVHLPSGAARCAPIVFGGGSGSYKLVCAGLGCVVLCGGRMT
jgi:hypothetical protein